MTLNLDSIFDNDPKLNPYDAKIFYDYQYQYEPYIFIFYRDRLVEAFTVPEIMSMAHTLRKSNKSIKSIIGRWIISSINTIINCSTNFCNK